MWIVMEIDNLLRLKMTVSSVGVYYGAGLGKRLKSSRSRV